MESKVSASSLIPVRTAARRTSLKHPPGARPKDNRACDFCRRRKIKCHTEAGTQRCSLCTRQNHSCTYDDPVLKRGPKKPANGEISHPSRIKPAIETSKQTPHDEPDQEPYLLYHLGVVRSLLALRSESWSINRETVELVLGFFELFGPDHPHFPLEMFIYILNLPTPPPHLMLMLSTICCIYLKHTNYPSYQFDHFYDICKSYIPSHTDLGMRLLSSSLLMVGQLNGQCEAEAQLHPHHRYLPPPALPPIRTDLTARLKTFSSPSLARLRCPPRAVTLSPACPPSGRLMGRNVRLISVALSPRSINYAPPSPSKI
ncbi:hypothetical protein L0F63_003480, partial [Massospora cicadina]